MAIVLETLNGFWHTLSDMAPYLIFGFFMAGVLSVFISASVVERHLGGSGFWPVFKASLFGVPLPLCSCSVIPVATSIRRQGSSKAATTSFLLSTPQTGVDSILVTYSLLGPVFAIFRPLAAFLVGLIGGEAVEIFAPDDDDESQSGSAAGCSCCSLENRKPQIYRILRHGFITLPSDIGKELLVGLLIAGGIGTLLPPSFFSDYIGTGFAAMLVMMLLGVPVYVCATASIPIAAAMISKGVSPGAALVFLMTGPATNAATIAAIWKTIGRRETIIYLMTVVFTALGSGVLLDLFFELTSLPAISASRWMPPLWMRQTSAVALLAIIAYALWGEKLRSLWKQD